MKKIGVLTSGGDSQGMNAAIYATVRYGLQQGFEVYGIRNGYKGLVEDDVIKLTAKSVEGIAHRGGTILGTARCAEMRTVEGQRRAVATLNKRGIEGLVVIGGDGSFAGAKTLSTDYNIKTIGIPGTIDNDLAYTDYTLGFDTAVTIVANAVEDLRDTMSCNDRTCVVEVMGNRCGDIALYAGLACGAEAVIPPEASYDVDWLVSRIKANAKKGKLDNIILVAEGVRTRDENVKGKVAECVMEDILARLPKINIRSMVLGHLQRSGDATAQDRLLGIRMGTRAVQCLSIGLTNRAIGVKYDAIFDMDIVEALAQTKAFNTELYQLANRLAIY